MSLQLPAVDPGDPRYVTRGARYIPALEGPTIWAAGDVYTVKATAAQTGGLLGFLEASVPPGGGRGEGAACVVRRHSRIPDSR